GLINPSHLVLSARSEYRGAVEIRGAYWTKDNAELTERSDIVILSVRPDQFSAVKINARGKLLVSLMAGVPTRRIADQTNADRVVRAMPNAAVTIRRSFTPWFATAAVSAEERQTVQDLFTTCGDADEVALESHIDYCVGLTGSGAAFPALLAQ